MLNFLIVFGRRTGERSELRVYADVREAMRARFARERSCRDEPDIEVVVLTARSEQEIRATHRRYFETMDGLTRAVGPHAGADRSGRTLPAAEGP